MEGVGGWLGLCGSSEDRETSRLGGVGPGTRELG